MEKKSTSEKKMQVIKIIDEFTILVSLTKSSRKITTDDWIIVYEEGPVIEDLDGNNLGTFDFTKAKLKIIQVFPNFVVAKHLRPGTPFSMDKILGGSGYVNNGPLPIENESQITNFKPQNPEISLGDLVKVI
ncbi:hypothetical protein [Lactococcus lactis]|uniref:hypothetical protein n=1 Tax=Lactococcus lactis TaxID=1358 RepID=UPI00288D0141|nr:hypothetical protein [Lactococcus lactis]MDT2895555.1 hypothetical protein [Lactococcus lactis]MDT2902739.1 hypothetical protein [Lactococcus lactis]